MRDTLHLAHLNRTRPPWRWSLFALDWRFPRGLDWLYDCMDSVWLVRGTRGRAPCSCCCLRRPPSPGTRPQRSSSARTGSARCGRPCPPRSCSPSARATAGRRCASSWTRRSRTAPTPDSTTRSSSGWDTPGDASPTVRPSTDCLYIYRHRAITCVVGGILLLGVIVVVSSVLAACL